MRLMENNQNSEKKDAQRKSQTTGLHKGGPSASNKKVEKHRKDESGGSDEGKTKKHGNSI
jgi:hypothetical protein